MQNIHEFITAVQQVLPPKQVLLQEPMSRHTTFKIGGPADCLIFPASLEDAVAVFKLIRRYQVPVTVLGNGSNVLVFDKGIRGAVVKFNSPYASVRQEGTHLFAGAGAALKDISVYAARCGLTGMEFAVGIPGSIGGAVFMNAGAYDGEIKTVVESVTAVSLEGEIIRYGREELEFGYRHSVFQANNQAICEVELALSAGELTVIEDRMENLTERRESRQPLEMPSAGSTFKRPEGYFAGTLIEQTGLKGFKVGGAQISLKHAGFVVNSGGATAQDVLDLIKEVQNRVYQAHGVKLFPEVRMLGEQ
ncbi:MAG: UDP-N-acetylmuramate dehydrogenase [Selenomonadaceae bacterium]